MKRTTLPLLVGLILLGPTGRLIAQQAPSFAKDIRPFLSKYCIECHNPKVLKAGLSLETYDDLKSGADSGAVLVPGKADQSKLVFLVEGKKKPFMPPRSAKQPKDEERKLLRAWVAAGAKDDSDSVKVQLPDIKPRVPALAPISALAYRPDGKRLAVGVHKEVLLIDPPSGEVAGKLSGQGGPVTALTYSPDGKYLAVASGVTGTIGEVRLYDGSTAEVGASPQRILSGHKDVLYGIAFSPDSKVLATGGYDRLVRFWDVATGKELRTLKDHSDTVYSLAFSPDGKLFASGAADRAVKVYDVTTGKLLYTLGESTDWVYALAWSPEGRYLAAAGVDKSIRVWEVSAAGGKIVYSVFAHEGPITRLVYSADGKTLYSLGEDRMVKSWDAARMLERKVYPRQPEVPLTLALRPQHAEFALGRYDGVVLLIDQATGKVLAQPVPVKPKPPQVVKLSPPAGQRGKALRLVFEGNHLDTVTEVVADPPGVSARLLPEKTPTRVVVEAAFPADAPARVYRLSLKGPAGQTTPQSFTVDLFPLVAEVEPNNSPGTGQKITLPTSIAGKLDKEGDVDYYRFEAEAGQQLGVQVLTAAIGSKVEPVLQLTNASGQVLAESGEGVLGYTFAKAGTYALGVRDQQYRGGPAMSYRLHLGDIPVITSVFPLGLQRGTETDIEVLGVHLGSVKSVKIKAPPNAALGSRLPVSVSTSRGMALGNKTVVVGEFAELIARPSKADNTSTQVPFTANGVVSSPGATDTWRFTAKKGQRLILEVNARRLGSALDSYVEVLDLKGQPIARATLRCQAKTYITFRDHGSTDPGIRIESWNELAINDYLYVGNELIRIRALPRNPDDDCQFFSVANQRVGQMDTTPTHHSMGSPMYKVSIHPPGTTFPPNGMPVYTLFYRNDDGGPGYGRDSRLYFDPPADGDYLVRIGDSLGLGGKDHAYRLTVRPPRPDFTVSWNPTSPSVWKGGAIPIKVSANRVDAYEGPINLHLENLPPGFSAPATRIPAGENSTTFALYAEAAAKNPDKVPPLKLVAQAKIGDQVIRREVMGGLPKAVEPGDLVTTTGQSEVTVKPGGEVRLSVKIDRRKGFKGRVPIDVRGLPHGVRVLDIGLNGILITESETTRTFVIYAEPWVQAIEQPFVVLAQREGKGTEYAAKSVTLRVSAK
jgi:WD40 repeat protein